ncbi:MAG: 2-amino-4-hydroxy-6-hydroxymethyldihydropteridine diphosphokinase [Alphaproteobacteria bacterium CG11_big_fil_rev_8_21_14_0_20_39_49]|nr:MAG: 2-amino-4-hydroxy-6-hydroxymethyldihydropteridine diphosphokinase [Alphaproteobacteria bacterium CG11_big_fil_rev_8_21_14_0_20_39_49]
MVILGLGSNFGNRMDYLSKAVNKLSKSVLAAVEMSNIYESTAILKNGSPDSWNQKFLNMAIRGETHLSPSELLKQIKMIEKELGRLDRGVWAPREIDIDILAYDNIYINNDELTIPHKHLYTRPFALVPLAELAPNWQCPMEGAFKGKTAYEITDQLISSSNEELIKTDNKITISDILVA